MTVVKNVESRNAKHGTVDGVVVREIRVLLESKVVVIAVKR